MKKIIIVIIFIIFIFDIKVNALSLPIDVTADSVIVVNLDKDEVIYEKNPDKVQILASLTKIMTAYTVIENVHDLKEKVTIRGVELYPFSSIDEIIKFNIFFFNNSV